MKFALGSHAAHSTIAIDYDSDELRAGAYAPEPSLVVPSVGVSRGRVVDWAAFESLLRSVFAQLSVEPESTWLVMTTLPGESKENLLKMIDVSIPTSIQLIAVYLELSRSLCTVLCL